MATRDRASAIGGACSSCEDAARTRQVHCVSIDACQSIPGGLSSTMVMDFLSKKNGDGFLVKKNIRDVHAIVLVYRELLEIELR